LGTKTIFYNPKIPRKNNKMKNLLEINLEGKSLVLATVNEQSCPHTIIITCYKVLNERQILLCDTYLNETLKNIQNNKQVAISFLDNSKIGYEFQGQAEYFQSGELFKLCQKLKSSKRLDCKGALVINLEKINISKNRNPAKK